MDSKLKFRMTNIGVVKQADVELGDFTIIVGRNNTGKTHMAYAIYGFLRGFREIMLSEPFAHSLDEHFKRIASLTTRQIVDLLRDKGRVEWEINEVDLQRERRSLLVEMTRIYSESGLANVFSASPESFANASFEIDLNHTMNKDIPLAMRIEEGRLLSFSYDGARVVVSLTGDQPPEDPVVPHLIQYWLQWTYPYFLLDDPAAWGYDPFILSTQRFSVSLFYRELDSKRSKIVRLLQQEENQQKGRRELTPAPMSRTSRLSLPIHDNIDFARNLSDLTQSRSVEGNLNTVSDLVELVGGQYELEDEAILFTSSRNKKEAFAIPLHLASSAAGEMSFMYFFLKHVNDKHDYLLIIDEPECHLDTANQIQITRMLARLVNSGTKVLITTHSDYIAKEVNNLIMLSGSFADKEETVRCLGYQSDDYLNPDSVRAYVAENETLTPCPKDKYGVDLPLFDKTIDDINRVSDDLYARLNEVQEEA
ncbi:MAG: AAA family ATPase [Caldilineaceae bacterium]|nr:AAA family ATPase [Caldilineaceae bacterium]